MRCWRALLACLLLSASGQAYIITTSLLSVSGQGYVAPFTPDVSVNFNSGLLPTSGLAIYSGGRLVTGSVSGQYAAPAGDTSTYLTIGTYAGLPSTTTQVTITLARQARVFGLNWGTPDTYNSIAFYQGNILVGSLAGTTNAAAAYYTFTAGNASENFDRVVLTSTQNAFESDNHAFVFVPEPAISALCGVGLLILGLAKRRGRS